MIDISKKLYSILSGSTVSGYTDRIYPLITPDQIEENTFPFIVYERSTSIDTTKDGGYSIGDTTFSITIFSLNYSQSIDIAKEVDSVLNGYKGGEILNCRLSMIDETYYQPAFIQKLVYQIKSR